jgi:glycosyltransferase involved in cell wall biosynthesis
MKIVQISNPFAGQQETSENDLTLKKKWIEEQLRKKSRKHPLRVLIGSNSLACGGAEHQIMRFMPHLKALGLEVEHMYYGAPHFLREQFKERQLCSHFLDRNAMGQLRFWKRAVSLIRSHQYDVVHAFGQTANFYVRGAGALAGAPVLIAGWRSRTMDRRLRWRVPISLLNLTTCAWIVNSESNSEALKCLWGLRKMRIYVVPNALDVKGKDFTMRGLLDKDISAWINGRMVVGAVGRSEKQKNFDLFFDVAKIVAKTCHDVCFCLVGGPAGDPESVELDRHMRGRIERENLSGFVKMLGRFDNVSGFLPHLSVLLCTSDYEGCPNVVLEGMRAELPIVMTDCCDTRSLIDQGKSGYVVPIGNVGEMADRTVELLNDSIKRQSFGKRSRELVKSHFRAENSAWTLAQIYVREWKRKNKINKREK